MFVADDHGHANTRGGDFRRVIVPDLVSLTHQLHLLLVVALGPDLRIVAVEVEEILPEVVKTDTEGMKSVDYGKMVGVLIQAIKDLKNEIDDLKNGV